MQQIACTRCGYTLAGSPGSMAVCPNCGQQTMIPGGSAQGWAPYPGAGMEQPGQGSGPSYGQPTSPFQAPPQYGGPGGGYGAPQMQPGGYPGNYPSGYPTPPAPARRNALLPVALVVLLLLVAGGAYLFIRNQSTGNKSAARATATTGPTATATTPALPSGYTLYNDPNGHYSIGYPSDWTQQNSNTSGVNATLFLNSGQTDVFEVADLPSSGATTSQLSTVLDQFFTGFASSLPGGGTVANTSSPQDVTIAGQTWTQESGDINYTDTAGNPATSHSEVSAISRNGRIYIIADATQDGSAFDTEKSQYFAPMINTFNFK